MHASLHSLAHRAPSATRTRVRWQPYSSLDSNSNTSSNTSSGSAGSSLLTRSPSNAYNTPCSSIASSPPPAPPTSSCDVKPPSTKQKFVVGLIEQTVKVLTDTWHPQDIPQVYLTGVRSPDFPEQPLFAQPIQPPPAPAQRNTQLPSPISPSIHAPPHNASGAESGLFGSTQCNLVPLRNYVHEVLRRSRTSGGVLQTALCYLDAVRPRLDEIVDQEKRGFGAPPVPVLDEVIIQGTEADIAAASDEHNSYFTSTEDLVPTVRVTDESDPDCSMPAPTNMLHYAGTEQLPSPLLCPRRAFLAALILATKFTQDKCFSNRAWAKLSGLPPREVSRCERAMGDALGWRLWVGKAPVVPSAETRSAAIPVSTTVHSGRSLSRCQTENITARPSTSTFLVRPEDIPAMSSASSLRRSATLPTGESVQRDAKWDARPAQQNLLPIAEASTALPWTNTLSNGSISSPPGLSYSPSSTGSSLGDYAGSFSDDSHSPAPPSGKATSMFPQPWMLDPQYPLTYNVSVEGVPHVWSNSKTRQLV